MAVSFCALKELLENLDFEVCESDRFCHGVLIFHTISICSLKGQGKLLVANVMDKLDFHEAWLICQRNVSNCRVASKVVPCVREALGQSCPHLMNICKALERNFVVGVIVISTLSTLFEMLFLAPFEDSVLARGVVLNHVSIVGVLNGQDNALVVSTIPLF